MEVLPHLRTAWDVDRRIVLDSADKLVLVRFSGFEHSSSDVRAGSSTNTSSSLGQKRGRSSHDEMEAGMEHQLRTRQMDELLTILAPKVRKYCTIFLVDTNEVPQFNEMYELGHDKDPFAILFFYRNTHIRVDAGTGNNNKINFFAFEDYTDFLPLVDAAYRAGKLGKHLASCDRTFSTVSIRR